MAATLSLMDYSQCNGYKILRRIKNPAELITNLSTLSFCTALHSLRRISAAGLY